LKYRKKFKIY